MTIKHVSDYIIIEFCTNCDIMNTPGDPLAGNNGIPQGAVMPPI